MEIATGAAQARGIYQVSLMLRHFNGIVMKDGDAESLPGKQRVGIAGLTFAFVVLRALAAEIALKVLYTQQTGKNAERTHDLSKLFQSLPVSVRTSISQRFQVKRQQKTIREVFEIHNNSFTDWRYAYQNPKLQSNFGDLEQAIETVLEELGA